MKVQEQLVYLARLHGLDAAAAKRSATELLGRLGLEERSNDTLESLSLGNQQRAQIAAALVHHPSALVLDEPFSGLDPVNQERLEGLILEQRDRGATIILSTHVMAHAQRLCDGLVIIAGGQRRFVGTVEEARAMLPLGVRYRPRADADPAAIAALLPGDAIEKHGEWRFTLSDEGVEPLLSRLIAGHHGVEGLSIDRPGLHEAFVRIVGETRDDRDAGETP
jgi:ABC-2 type transport system ATP-binding protein